ncbi:MAG: hypothetical protein GDA40_11100 [Rhodobacteraceae bacterium]|nr:hypothetical protein [Paracoccaceae bacterium]
MNGAHALVKTFLQNGLDTVFANPGTSEMHVVAALDDHPEMRCVLYLFEGGTTGVADGYFQMKRDVADTLLHLTPGLATPMPISIMRTKPNLAWSMWWAITRRITSATKAF